MIAEPLLEAMRQLSGALLDAFAVVDADLQIVEFNRGFYSLFPRTIARQLKKKTLTEVMRLELAGQTLDVARECMTKEVALRYDEVVGHLADAEAPIDLIVAAVPLVSQSRLVEGAFVSLRNVTDEAQVQTKYKSMLEEEAREREMLQQRIQEAEAELVAVKDTLAGTEKELLDYKKGLLI